MGFLGPLIAGVASLGAGALGLKGQADANAANARQARENREFQERMSSTSWQRGVADMRAAGVNPMLALQQGGASSPGGAQATMENVAAGLSNSARDGVHAVNEVRTRQAQIENLRAETAQKRSQEDLTRAQADMTRAELNQLRIESANRLLKLDAEIRLLGANFGKTQAEEHVTLLNKNYLYNTLGPRIALESARLDRERTSARQGRAAAVLDELLAPGARNDARAEQGWWRQNVTRRLQNAKQLTDLLNPLMRR